MHIRGIDDDRTQDARRQDGDLSRLSGAGGSSGCSDTPQRYRPGAARPTHRCLRGEYRQAGAHAWRRRQAMLQDMPASKLRADAARHARGPRARSPTPRSPTALAACSGHAVRRRVVRPARHDPPLRLRNGGIAGRTTTPRRCAFVGPLNRCVRNQHFDTADPCAPKTRAEGSATGARITMPRGAFADRRCPGRIRRRSSSRPNARFNAGSNAGSNAGFFGSNRIRHPEEAAQSSTVTVPLRRSCVSFSAFSIARCSAVIR